MYAHVYSLSLPFYCLFGTLVISSRSRQVIYLIYNIVTVFMVFSLSVSIYLLITNRILTNACHCSCHEEFFKHSVLAITVNQERHENVLCNHKLQSLWLETGEVSHDPYDLINNSYLIAVMRQYFRQ